MDELILAFTTGNAAILTNACLLPLYPGLIAFLAGSAQDERARRAAAWLGIPVLAGILSMMLLIGFVLTLIATTFASVLPILLPAIYLIVVVMGVLLLIGRNPFAALQTTQLPMLNNPYLTAYLYGLLLAPMTLPCTGPIIVSAFALGTDIQSLGDGLLYFLFFGLGFGWPLVILPLFALPFQRRIVGTLALYKNALNRASGVLLLAVGVFGVLTELLPRTDPTFEITPEMQLLFWAVALLLALAVGYAFTQREKRKLAA